MPRRLTRSSRWAAVAAMVLALVLLERAVNAAVTSTMLLTAVVALLALLGGFKMWLHNCFESHLVVVLVGAATCIGTLLSLTLGVPGSGRTELSVSHIVTLLLTVTMGLLLVLDARERRAQP